MTPNLSKIDWILVRWHQLPPHVQETITLLVDKSVEAPDDELFDDLAVKSRLIRSARTMRLHGLSRWLLKVLRHTPEAAGVSMDANGWVSKRTGSGVVLRDKNLQFAPAVHSLTGSIPFNCFANPAKIVLEPSRAFLTCRSNTWKT